MKISLRNIVCLAALMLSAGASAQQGATSPVTLNRIGDNLYEVLGGSGANGGAYIGEYGVLLIDAKMNKESVDQTIAEIRKLTEKPIRYMVNTHSDGDHVNGNKFFPESVVFVAHEKCREEFFHPGRNGEPSSWNDPELAKYIPSVTFTTKMDLYPGPDPVELWYFGTGHTKGDIVVYFPKDRIAFIGDQVFKGRVQLIHSYKGGNSFEHVRTLELMLKTLDAQKFCSGHGEMMNRADITGHVSEMKEVQNKVAGYVRSNYNLESIKKEFRNDQATLVEAIYNEIKAGKI
jgi:glyoxylase-like metal-dependent hydrolase (beta-lactamase superfamily II)